MNIKENSGYQKTHQKIKDSLLRLIEDKELRTITVNEICISSQINRSTFYAHFQDIYEVMEQIEQEMEKSLIAAYQDNYVKGTDFLSAEYTVVLMEHMRLNQIFYKALFQDSNAQMLNESMELLRTEVFRPIFDRIGLTEREGRYHFNFFKSGFLTVLKQWLEEGCVETPQELAAIIARSIPKAPEKLFVVD